MLFTEPGSGLGLALGLSLAGPVKAQGFMFLCLHGGRTLYLPAKPPGVSPSHASSDIIQVACNWPW